MSSVDVLDYLKSYVNKTPEEDKSNRMVLVFALPENTSLDEMVNMRFNKEIYTYNVSDYIFKLLIGGTWHTNSEIRYVIYKFLKKSWEFAFAGDEIIQSFLDVEDELIEKRGCRNFYVVKIDADNTEINQIARNIILDFDCLLIGGYLLKSAEGIKF